MTVSTPATNTVTDAAPVARPVRRVLMRIEAVAYEASAELVHQRGHFEEAQAHDAEHDALLDAALKVDGLPPYARDLIVRALHADDREDAAHRRADQRREAAHGYTREIAGRVELTLTGRTREVMP